MKCDKRFTTYERIDLKLKDGPFRRLEGSWTFQALREDACKVVLMMEFEFSGRLIDVAFGRFFNQAANSLVDSFVARARELHGG